MTEEIQSMTEGAATPPPPETVGAAPLFAEMPSFEAAGKTYQMRRLRPRTDHTRLARLLRIGDENGVKIKQAWADGTLGEELSKLVEVVIERAPDDFYGLLASTIGVESAAFDDPEQFPPETMVFIYLAFMAHPDVLSFFGLRAITAAAARQAEQTQANSTEASSDSSI